MEKYANIAIYAK